MRSGDGTGIGDRGRFRTTRWSLVLAAGKGGTASAAEALASLCSLYWHPVFAFVRRSGHPAEEAQDLTQGFFARLIERGDLGAADPSRGRFRSFLLGACRHFLSNERDRAQALKRGGGRPPVSIDVAVAEERYEGALAQGGTPEHLFDREWCLALLASALDDVRRDYQAAGNERLFQRLSGFLSDDASAGTHADAGRDLRMTAAAVKVAVHRLRRRYRDALRRRVADTVESPEEVDDEIRCLMAVLGRGV